MSAGSTRGTHAERASALQAELRAVVDRAHALDTRALERAPEPELVDDVLAHARAVVDGALAAFDRILATYDTPVDAAPVAGGEGFGANIDELLAREHGAQRIADLSFVARLELRTKRDQLATLRAADGAWAAISGCSSSRRKTLKAAAAVELALAQHEGVPSVVEGVYASEIQRSLKVRRAYARFRLSVASAPAPTAEQVLARLRTGAVSIAKLVGDDVYEDLRLDDRMQLRVLQDRIIAWLSGSDGRVPRSGLRLFQDLAAFAGTLVLVNNRVELREHDRRLVEQLLPALPPVDPAAPLTPELARTLAPLTGRDDELDVLLLTRPAPPAGDLRGVLVRLLAPLQGAVPSGPGSSGDAGSPDGA